MAINYEKLREKMVKEQLIKRGISDSSVIKAFEKVKREKFMPAHNRNLAYEDAAQIIGSEQTISQPYIVALMIENLALKSSDKVLEIGTGSGYAAALLAEIVKEVYTIERIGDLALKAEKRFKELNYEKIKLKVGDGTLGWEENAPYDAILVSAAAPYIPDKLVAQLAVGGRLLIPVGKRRGVQRLEILKKKSAAKTIKKQLDYVRFVPLIGEDSWS